MTKETLTRKQKMAEFDQGYNIQVRRGSFAGGIIAAKQSLLVSMCDVRFEIWDRVAWSFPSHIAYPTSHILYYHLFRAWDFGFQSGLVKENHKVPG